MLPCRPYLFHRTVTFYDVSCPGLDFEVDFLLFHTQVTPWACQLLQTWGECFRRVTLELHEWVWAGFRFPYLLPGGFLTGDMLLISGRSADSQTLACLPSKRRRVASPVRRCILESQMDVLEVQEVRGSERTSRFGSGDKTLMLVQLPENGKSGEVGLAAIWRNFFLVKNVIILRSLLKDSFTRSTVVGY